MMRLNLAILLLAVILFTGFASAGVIMSDQGTDVREKSTGNLLSIGNLSVKIYGNSSGGSAIYEQTFPSTIVNGSWNVIITPDLEFGTHYWKDYEINGENLDFDGNDRVEFQSSLGIINNISYFNLSLISSCSAGSSIRAIYNNGSVICESDDAGNSTSSTDLSNYALKNQTETFNGNLTAETGFFSFLGSLTQKISKLFATDIDVSRNINASGNVTASYFIGDGSKLTGISLATSYTHLSNFTNDMDFVNNTGLQGYNDSALISSVNSSLTSSKLATSDQRYNDTALINDVNSSLSAIINGISGGSYNSTYESTFNASYAQSAYNQTTPAISVANAYTNSVNATQIDWVATTFLKISNAITQYFNRTDIQNQYYNKSDIDVRGYANSSDIQVYNETTLINAVNSSLSSLKLNATDQRYNETIYINNQITGLSNSTIARIANCSAGQVVQNITPTGYQCVALSASGSTFNSTYETWAYNQTTPANSYTDSVASSNSVAWGTVFNATYNNLLNQSCPTGKFVNGTQANGSLICASVTVSESDALAIALINGNNSAWLSIYNSSYEVWSYNQTTPAVSNANSYTNSKIIELNNASVVRAGNCSAGQVVANISSRGVECITPASGGSYNQTYESTLNTTYAQYAYNQTSAANSYSDSKFLNLTGTNANQNMSIGAYNLSTSGTGFFGWLGSLAARITTLWVVDINATGNIKTSQNISGEYIYGSLNYSAFPNSACSGTDKVTGLNDDGSVSCAADETGSGGGSNQVTPRMLNILAFALTETNAPLAERIIGNTYYIACTNLTGYSQYRIGVARAATNGAAAYVVKAKYIASPATTITASSWSYLNSTDNGYSVTSQNTAGTGSWHTMPSSLDEVCISGFTVGGDGALDPQWRGLWIEVM